MADGTFPEIDHLDFPVDDTAGLIERAVQTYKSLWSYHESRALTVAGACLSSTLGVTSALDTTVVVNNSDGDAVVECKIDGIQFKVSIVYPSGAGEKAEPDRVELRARVNQHNWALIKDLYNLGALIDKGELPVQYD
jgi:hypothetical protein